MPTPVVVLVGGQNTHAKNVFYRLFTDDTKHSIGTTLNTEPLIVLANTPSDFENRDPNEYSWDGIFKFADVIVNFGNWKPEDIAGVCAFNPVHITWSGDHDETMKRIIDIVQRG